MHIQSFVLCRQLVKDTGIGEWFAKIINPTITPPNYPFNISLKYLMILGRDQKDGDLAFIMKFRVIDEDGKICELDYSIEEIFPNGCKSISFSGNISLIFTKKGSYRIDINIIEKDTQLNTFYPYSIELE